PEFAGILEISSKCPSTALKCCRSNVWFPHPNYQYAAGPRTDHGILDTRAGPKLTDFFMTNPLRRQRMYPRRSYTALHGIWGFTGLDRILAARPFSESARRDGAHAESVCPFAARRKALDDCRRLRRFLLPINAATIPECVSARSCTASLRSPRRRRLLGQWIDS